MPFPVRRLFRGPRVPILGPSESLGRRCDRLHNRRENSAHCLPRRWQNAKSHSQFGMASAPAFLASPPCDKERWWLPHRRSPPSLFSSPSWLSLVVPLPSTHALHGTTHAIKAFTTPLCVSLSIRQCISHCLHVSSSLGCCRPVHRSLNRSNGPPSTSTSSRLQSSNFHSTLRWWNEWHGQPRRTRLSPRVTASCARTDLPWLLLQSGSLLGFSIELSVAAMLSKSEMQARAFLAGTK